MPEPTAFSACRRGGIVAHRWAMRHQLERFTGIGALVAALTLSAVAAQAKPAPAPARAAALQALTDCRKQTDDAARLACYDKAAGALDEAEAQGQVVVIDRAQAKAVRREAFGFNLPSISLFNRNVHDEAVDRVEVELSEARKNAEGRWVMATTTDQVWRQTDGEELYRDPRQGLKMLVRRGALGSYFCKVEGDSAVRCTRER